SRRARAGLRALPFPSRGVPARLPCRPRWRVAPRSRCRACPALRKGIRRGSWSAAPFFAHRYRKAVRIQVLRDAHAERFLRLLDATHLVPGHLLVELIEIRDA